MALEDVIDPELGISVVDVGLIYRVEVSEKGEVEIDYTLTTPGCPLADVIEKDIRHVLEKKCDAASVVLSLVWTPPWCIDFMSEDARLTLGYPV